MSKNKHVPQKKTYIDSFYNKRFLASYFSLEKN